MILNLAKQLSRRKRKIIILLKKIKMARKFKRKFNLTRSMMKLPRESTNLFRKMTAISVKTVKNFKPLLPYFWMIFKIAMMFITLSKKKPAKKSLMLAN